MSDLHMIMTGVCIMIVIMVMVMVVMVGGVAMRMTMSVIIAFAQQPGAGQVHAQPQRRNRDCLAIMDGDRVQEPQHRTL